MDPLLVLSLLLSFFLTLFFTPIWIKGTQKAGLVGKDMHKTHPRKISESGGVAVLFGFILGVLSYVAINTFYFKSEIKVEVFALLSSIMIIGTIGLLDDILGWKIGLTKKTRLFFIALGAIPLMVLNSGNSTLMGINVGILYPLILVPIGIVCASVAFNSIAGYNGLEASQGALILLGLAFITYKTGNAWLSVIALCMVAALVAFYLFNKNPARIFPGDSLTYPIGGIIAVIAILGDIEKIAIAFFALYIIEPFLKIRGKLEKESFAKVNADGSLDIPYKKVYGVEHFAIKILKKWKKKVYEKDVVLLINLTQIVIILVFIVLFLTGNF